MLVLLQYLFLGEGLFKSCGHFLKLGVTFFFFFSVVGFDFFSQKLILFGAPKSSVSQ